MKYERRVMNHCLQTAMSGDLVLSLISYVSEYIHVFDAINDACLFKFLIYIQD